jgi:NAD(P)-dependent dehydrogenase (short-subunit alcohol dehydrogenase family)
MKSVQGRNVLVTGAAMGMGRLFAERAVTERASAVVLWDRDEGALVSTIDELEALARDASGTGLPATTLTGYVIDVSDADVVAATAAEMSAELGRMDVVVNNAGIVRGNAYFWETDVGRDVTTTVAVNTLAPMYVAHSFLPAMIAAPDECRLVNLASAAGFTPNPRMAAYAASKWAVIGWSDSVRLELKQAGHGHVKVTTVCPYYTRTGMFDGAHSAPLLPLLDPLDVVEEAWRGMLDGRAFVVLPRTVQLAEVLKGVVPTGVRDFLADRVFGVYHSMDDFTGRPLS